MARVVGGICLMVFLTSLAVHIASYALFVPPLVEAGAGFLHLAVMFVCLLALLLTAAEVRRVRRQQGGTHAQARQAVWERLPRPAVALALVVFLYFWGIGAWLRFGVEWGTPRPTEDGRFVLESHGVLIRALGAEEYRRLQAYHMRAASACWVSFSLWATVFVWSLARGRTDRTSPSFPPPQPLQQTAAISVSGNS